MDDQGKTKDQLICELGQLRHRVAELEAVEAEYRQSEELLQAIIHQSPVPTAVGGSDGSIICFNSALEELVGYRRCDIHDVTDWATKLYPDEEYRAFVWKNIGQALNGQKQDCTEFTITCKDGVRKVVDFQTSFFRDGLIIQMLDITDRKQMEERVQTQERLAGLGQLAAGIAHDFNNILTSMIGYAELLGMRPDTTASAKSDLRKIVAQGRNAAYLIRQILDFGRKSLIQPKRLDLASFLKETTEFLQRTIPENIRTIWEMGPEAYPVHADPTQIQQVLTNLAVNARDAMPEGGELRLRLSRLTLQARERPPVPEMSSGEWILLSVSDTGVGIPPEALPHIYEPFFTTKDPSAGQGTGLGLAQVYGIVRQHDGFIDQESQEGEGTTFTVYLPALEGTDEEPEQEASEEFPSGEGETVLVVEDEPSVLKMIGEVLGKLGYRSLTASSSREALEIHSQHREEIALVLTDMVMPGMGGRPLSLRLREQNPDVKVVAMTGYPLEDSAEALLAEGIANWVQKPMRLGELARVLKEVLA